ncbi:hypothetical protein BGZ65_007088 [Modicella reniformis]|uniref:Uncharacterized protein n=1 Tax=Modicella reniformis TaxID=1440133 RepID=A0A9P6JH02_9FUNG|nr:hypothetical protein BGZ65_007088 [Modicella reniformis]
MVQNPTMWILDRKQHGLIKSFTLMSNSTMYTIGKNLTGSANDAILTRINIVNGSTTVPPATSMWPVRTQLANYSSSDGFVSSGCQDYKDFNMMTEGSTVAISCRDTSSGHHETNLYIYAGGQLEGTHVDGYFENVRSILPVNSATVPYIFMHNCTGIYGVMLAGSERGGWQSNPTGISIPDPEINGSNQKSGGSILAAIIGVIGAVAFIIHVVLMVSFYRKRLQTQNANQNISINVNTNANTNANTNSNSNPSVSQASMDQYLQQLQLLQQSQGGVSSGLIPVERVTSDPYPAHHDQAAPNYDDLYPHQPQGYLPRHVISGVDDAPSIHVHS